MRESHKGGIPEWDALNCLGALSPSIARSLLQFSTRREPALPEPAAGAWLALNQPEEKPPSSSDGFYVLALAVYSF